ncbi:MAG: hypothetical protein ACI924_001106, partial [Flavobacterium sp.]
MYVILKNDINNNMISIEKIKKEFEYLSEADNENLYSGIWKF